MESLVGLKYNFGFQFVPMDWHFDHFHVASHFMFSSSIESILNSVG